MKKIVFNFLLLAVLMLGVSSSQALAQSKPLKGYFQATLTIPQLGSVPVGLSFKNGGKGTLTGTSKLQLVYREDSNGNFSASVEVPAQNSPNGQAVTVVIRGTKTDDNNFEGVLILILDAKDPSSPIQFVAAPGKVTGKRV